jgi:hypothetical protein
MTPGWGGGGDEFLFKLLKDLRGRLLHTACDDLAVWPVAALNGDRLVLLVFNDHREERSIRVAVDAPAGTTLGAGRAVWVTPKEAKGPLEFRERAVPAEGRHFVGDFAIAQRTGLKLVFPLEGTPPAEAQWLRRQFFAKGVLQEVARGKPLALSVKVDEALLRRAEAAWVKLVLEGVRGGEGAVGVNGTRVPLPDHDWVTEVAIEPKLLRADNRLVFETSGDGYRVDVASLALEGPAER